MLSKYFKFIYLDWNSITNTLIYSKSINNSLIQIILIESMSLPIVLDKFIPNLYCDVNKNHYNYLNLKNYINNHMKKINKYSKNKIKKIYTNIISENINDDYFLNWFNSNINIFIEKELYFYLIDTIRYVKYKSFDFYICLTYILTHSNYNNILINIKLFAKTKFFYNYLNTSYSFSRKNLSINYKIPTVGNIIIPYKYYYFEEKRTYILQYYKTIKPILDSVKYNKYNKLNKLLRILINLLFSSINLIILLIYVTLAVIVNYKTNTQFITYNFKY